jgi:hypothetical protein
MTSQNITQDVIFVRHPRRLVRYAAVESNGLEMVVEASGDTSLDDIILFVAGDQIDKNLDEPFDTAVFAGGLLVAMVEHREGQLPRIRRLDQGAETRGSASDA